LTDVAPSPCSYCSRVRSGLRRRQAATATAPECNARDRSDLCEPGPSCDLRAVSGGVVAVRPPMLASPGPQQPQTPGPGLGQLSARERELVTRVAQGATNAQIAAQLYISVRTVSSHLDRIQDKTSCRRADLTGWP